MRRDVLLATAFFVAAGCGGEVQQDPDGGGGSQGDPSATGTGSTSGSGVGSGSKPRLEDCVPGTPIDRAKSCLWFADQTCYSTKEAACNCICPTNVVRVYCISDMRESGVPTEVYCTSE